MFCSAQHALPNRSRLDSWHRVPIRRRQARGSQKGPSNVSTTMALVFNWRLARFVLPHVPGHREHDGSQLAAAGCRRRHSAGDAVVGLERRSPAAHRVAAAAYVAVKVIPEHTTAIRLAPGEPACNPWLDLDVVAEVTISVAGQRVARCAGAWSADRPGEQTIEIRFRHAITVSRVRVVSREAEQSRTQEMTIWASLRRGERHREVLRQHFNFSPGGATEQVEEYAVQLEDVSALQVRIVPCIDGRRAVARVSELCVAE